MPQRPMVDVVGAVDIHVHSAPSYTHHRPWDDDVTAQHGVSEGMAGIVLKDHTEPTVTRAYLAQKAAPGIRMFGGVVLNHSVGGINPDAADFACTMGAAQVWCPTVDALRHSQVFPQGNYATAAEQPAEGRRAHPGSQGRREDLPNLGRDAGNFPHSQIRNGRAHEVRSPGGL